MCWLGSGALAVLSCGGLAVAAPADDAGVQVEQYLDRNALKSLLAEQLMTKLPRLSGEEKTSTIQRLGKLYVELLSTASKQEDKDYWQERAKELVRLAPEAQTHELRLNLLRAQYAQAEDMAERWRLALADAEQKAEAERLMRVYRVEFERIGQELVRRVDQLERLDVIGRDPQKMQEDLGDARRMRAVAFYYAGWSAYYQAMLTGSEQTAGEALRLFTWVVGRGAGVGGKDLPRLENAQKGSFKYEATARAGVGVALAYGVMGNEREASRWLDAIENDAETPVGVKETLLLRRIAIQGAARRWDDIRAAVDRARKPEAGQTQPRALTVFAARLLVVVTLTEQERKANDAAAELAKIGMGDLVARQEVGQVLDLASRFGTAPLGDTGFIVNYVRGVRTYEDAIAAHKATGKDPEEPTDVPSVINQYRQAAEQLDLAIKQEDATKFASARQRALSLAGRSLYHASIFGLAGDRFVEASKLAEAAGDAASAEEQLWLAIIAMDKGARTTSNDAAQWGARADELTALFLKSYPRSKRAPTLVLRRSESGGIKDEEAVKVLMGVPRDDAAYEPSRRQAARLLYRIYRATGGEARGFAASRFTAVGQEVLGMEKRVAVGGDARLARDATQRLITVARQLLDALLSVPTPDATQAQGVLTELQSVLSFNGSSSAGFEDELVFRRFQIALTQGDLSGASEMAERLAAWTDPQTGTKKPSRFEQAAQRSLYVRAAELWRRSRPANGEALGEVTLKHAAEVVRYGKRVLESVSGAGAAPDLATQTLMGTVAGAAVDLWRGAADRENLKLAVELDQRLLKLQPNNAEVLRRVAETSEAMSDRVLALESWRTLASGYEPGTPVFFEAKYNVVRLLAMADRVAAARAIVQHAVLYPEYGPPPWGQKLKQLYDSLRDVAEQVLAEEQQKGKAPAGGGGGGGAGGGPR